MAAGPVIEGFLARLRQSFSALSDTEADPAAGGLAVADLEAGYQTAKAGLLRLGADRRLSVERLDALLDGFSGCHRLIDQFAKADRRLRQSAGEDADLSAGEPDREPESTPPADPQDADPAPR